MKGEIRNLDRYSPTQEKFDYELLTLPFYNIRHLTSIKIEPYSKELREEMSWKIIDWASDVVSKRNGDCETDVDAYGEQKLWVDVLDDYLWAHDQIFRARIAHYGNPILDRMCQEWMCTKFDSFVKYKLKREGCWIVNWDEIDGLSL